MDSSIFCSHRSETVTASFFLLTISLGFFKVSEVAASSEEISSPLKYGFLSVSRNISSIMGLSGGDGDPSASEEPCSEVEEDSEEPP